MMIDPPGGAQQFGLVRFGSRAGQTRYKRRSGLVRFASVRPFLGRGGRDPAGTV